MISSQSNSSGHSDETKDVAAAASSLLDALAPASSSSPSPSATSDTVVNHAITIQITDAKFGEKPRDHNRKNNNPNALRLKVQLYLKDRCGTLSNYVQYHRMHVVPSPIDRDTVHVLVYGVLVKNVPLIKELVDAASTPAARISMIKDGSTPPSDNRLWIMYPLKFHNGINEVAADRSVTHERHARARDGTIRHLIDKRITSATVDRVQVINIGRYQYRAVCISVSSLDRAAILTEGTLPKGVQVCRSQQAKRQLCHRCHHPGHKISECKDVKRCHYCDNPNHGAATCSNEDQNAIKCRLCTGDAAFDHFTIDCPSIAAFVIIPFTSANNRANGFPRMAAGSVFTHRGRSAQPSSSRAYAHQQPSPSPSPSINRHPSRPSYAAAAAGNNDTHRDTRINTITSNSSSSEMASMQVAITKFIDTMRDQVQQIKFSIDNLKTDYDSKITRMKNTYDVLFNRMDERMSELANDMKHMSQAMQLHSANVIDDDNDDNDDKDDDSAPIISSTPKRGGNIDSRVKTTPPIVSTSTSAAASGSKRKAAASIKPPTATIASPLTSVKKGDTIATSSSKAAAAASTLPVIFARSPVQLPPAAVIGSGRARSRVAAATTSHHDRSSDRVTRTQLARLAVVNATLLFRPTTTTP